MWPFLIIINKNVENIQPIETSVAETPIPLYPIKAKLRRHRLFDVKSVSKVEINRFGARG
jgi:hypothetical protein